MRGRVVFCLSLALARGPALESQAYSQPRLYLSAFIGYRVGLPIWSLIRQPFTVLMASGDTVLTTGSGQYDTLDLQRELDPGFVVGASGSYFPGPHLGFTGEVAFLGMGTRSACAIRQAQPPDPTDIDPALCANLDRQLVASNAVSFSAGVVGRLTPGRGTFPYVRADAGVIARTRGTIEMVAVYANGANVVRAVVVEDPHPSNTAVHLALGAGVAVTMGTAYQLRFEGRDVLALLDRVTGPANPSSASGALMPPRRGRVFHNFIFVMALDVVFEKRHGRRY